MKLIDKNAVEPKFRVGDKLISTRNPSLTYEVLEVGHINELGNLEYKVIIFADGKAKSPQDIHYLECKKVDEWAKLLEQKSTDKVEPKFKVGDWVVSPNGVYWHIDAIRNGRYKVSAQSGECADWPLDTNIYHKFTIQNAKDGDVLAVEWNQDNDVWEKILIFKALNDKGVEGYGNTFKNKGLFFTDEKVPYYSKTWTKTLHPATKEQRNLLFQKMHEDGYEWNAEKKELKIIDWSKHIKYEPNGASITKEYSSWSEEDEVGLINIINFFDSSSTAKLCPTRRNEAIAWLKSLKDRIQLQNSSVTDEELAQAKKDAYNNALDKIEYHSGEPTFDDGWSAAIWYLKKRNARPQNTWRPSDEQMEILWKYAEQNNYDGSVLTSLYNDLKKLNDKKE